MKYIYLTVNTTGRTNNFIFVVRPGYCLQVLGQDEILSNVLYLEHWSYQKHKMKISLVNWIKLRLLKISNYYFTKNNLKILYEVLIDNSYHRYKLFYFTDISLISLVIVIIVRTNLNRCNNSRQTTNSFNGLPSMYLTVNL